MGVLPKDTSRFARTGNRTGDLRVSKPSPCFHGRFSMFYFKPSNRPSLTSRQIYRMSLNSAKQVTVPGGVLAYKVARPPCNRGVARSIPEAGALYAFVGEHVWVSLGRTPDRLNSAQATTIPFSHFRTTLVLLLNQCDYCLT